MKGFMSLPGTFIRSICDVDTIRVDNARRTAHVPREQGHSDFRELIARDDIDVVVISTPDHWHALIAIAAVKAGKDVYLEKPLAYSVTEGRAIVNAVKKYGRILQTGSHQRSDRRFRFACELVRNGRIGKLHTIKVEIPENSRPNPLIWKIDLPPWYLDYDLWLGPALLKPYAELAVHYRWHFIYDTGSGQLTNWGAHMLDIAQWANDSQRTGPVEIVGKGIFPTEGLFETPLHYDIKYTYDNGVVLYLTTCRPGGPETGVRFEGSDGWLFVSRERILANPPSILKSIIGPNDIHLYQSINHHQDFLDCIRLRKQPAAPVEVGHRSATVCHLGDIAVRAGQKLKWNPQEERFTNSEEANRLLGRTMRPPWRL